MHPRRQFFGVCGGSKCLEIYYLFCSLSCGGSLHNLQSKMLDAFEILTTSGVVLWSRSISNIGASAVNSLINDVFIEEKVRPTSQTSSNPTYKHDKYTLKYTLVKDLGLIFVVCKRNKRCSIQKLTICKRLFTSHYSI